MPILHRPTAVRRGPEQSPVNAKLHSTLSPVEVCISGNSTVTREQIICAASSACGQSPCGIRVEKTGLGSHSEQINPQTYCRIGGCAISDRGVSISRESHPTPLPRPAALPARQ